MTRSIRGFSLLELMVVLVIVGIVAVASGTWFSPSQASAVKGTLGGVVGILSEARATARATGRTVTLSTTGTQGTLTISFPTQGDVLAPLSLPTANQVLTTWTRSAAGKDAAYHSGIDNAGWPVYTKSAPNPDPLAGNVLVIKNLFTNNTPPGTTGNLFQGGGTPTPTVFFDSQGRPNIDFYVYVGGMRSGESYASAPVGLVLVSRTNGIHAFYKSNAGDSTVLWQRL